MGVSAFNVNLSQLDWGGRVRIKPQQTHPRWLMMKASKRKEEGAIAREPLQQQNQF